MSYDNPYLQKLDSHLGNILDSAVSESDSYRSEILWNYLHHGAFELSGEWDRIFTPEMTVEEPHYEMRAGVDETVVLDGQESVKHFYEMIENEHMMIIDDGAHYLFVNDEALAEFGTTIEFVSGQDVLDDNVDKWFYNDPEIDDPDATYVKKSRHGMYWPYTEDAQLIGEMVYQITPFEVFKVDESEVPTLDEVAELAARYFPENVAEETPYQSLARASD